MARVLIIEDDKSVSLAVKDSLEFEGYESVISSDGKDGLSRAVNETFDIVLLDIMGRFCVYHFRKYPTVHRAPSR